MDGLGSRELIISERPWVGHFEIVSRSSFYNILIEIAHLDGGVLDHRSIMADGRNETETLTLCDMASTWTPTLTQRHRGTTATCDIYQSDPSIGEYHQLRPPSSRYATGEAAAEASQFYLPFPHELTA